MNHHHGSDQSDHSKLGWAFILNLIFTIIEIIGGLYTNSLAIISDAIHDLGDSMSIGLAWYLEKVSRKPGDLRFTYGYRRFSVLGAIITSIILVIGSVVIIQSAIPRLVSSDPVNSSGILILAALGIVFNGWAYYKLGHGHSHNQETISLHLLEDLLGWVALLVGGAVIHFTGWYIIDPILSVGIALFILFNVVKSIRKTITIVLQGTPDKIDMDHIHSKLLTIPGIEEIHDLHIWTMDGQDNILTAHLVIPAKSDMALANEIKARVHILMAEENITHCTLEIERQGEICQLQRHDQLTP